MKIEWFVITQVYQNLLKEKGQQDLIKKYHLISQSNVKFYDIVEIFPYKECDCVECIETLEYGQDAKRYNL